MTKHDPWKLTDRAWLLTVQPEATKEQMESFLERVAIKMADDIPEDQARWEAFCGE